MKNLLITLIAILSFSAFSHAQFGDTYNAQKQGNITVHTIKDPKTGAVNAYMPLHSDWKYTEKGIIGPNGETAQVIMGGSNYKSWHHIIDTYKNLMRQHGATLTNVQDLPGLAQAQLKEDNRLWSSVPCQKVVESKALEYTRGETKGAFILSFHQSFSQYGNFAFVTGIEMYSKSVDFNNAMSVIIKGLAGFKMDETNVANYNRNEQMKSQNSWAAHNSRMAVNRNTNASQKSLGQTYSEISDIQHKGYQDRSNIQYQGHQNSVDAIYEQQTVNNPYGGQQVQLQSGYDHYYINSNGDHIGTNDHFYNPNQHSNQEWTNPYDN
jgi:hypothetical protein